jgi:hypothetical protein
MTATELLAQRFLDHDLPATERVEFLVRLGRDAALREQLIDLERLAIDVARLPRPEVPPGFVAHVLERIAPPPAPFWRRWADAVRTPRDLRWNLASALATACLLLLVGAGLFAGGARWGGAADRPSGGASATRSGPVQVRLVVIRPGATTVEAAGDFNGWDPARTPLQQVSSDAWVVTIPLQPGRYEYMYVVDGQEWIADPFAVEQNDDGFGSRNAVLEVTPPTGDPL